MKANMLLRRWMLVAAVEIITLATGAQCALAQTVNIGVLTPLSPPGDPIAGQLMIRGAQLGVRYINERVNGVSPNWNKSCPMPAKLNIAIGDDGGLPEKGMVAFRQLMSSSKIAGVLGIFDSTVGLAVQPLAEQNKIPMFITQASSNQLTNVHDKFTFMTHTLAQDRSDVSEAFLKEYKFKRVAILAENTDYGITSGGDMHNRLVADKVESKIWIYDRANPDLDALLLQVKKFQPDVIYNMSFGSSAYLLIKQSADVGLLPSVPMVVSHDMPMRPEFWNNVGDLGKNMIFLSYYQPRQPLPTPGQWMQREYEKSYHEPAMYSSLAAFGNTILLAQAINAACSTDGDKMVDALRKGGLTSWNLSNVSFPTANGLDWQRLKQPIMVLQYTKMNQNFKDATILFPASMKTGEMVH